MSNLDFSESSLNFDGLELLTKFKLPLIEELSRTSAVTRLKDISFLGAIDYAIRPAKKTSYLTTRFDHSIGVAFLAKIAAEKMNASSYEVSLAAVSGLLHDLGHGPLSHSLESRFVKKFGLNHHTATEKLINGQDSNGIQINQILYDFQVNPVDVVNVLNGVYKSRITSLFCSSINVDTIEGIYRTAAYKRGFELKQSPALAVEALVAVLISTPNKQETSTLDCFWALKNEMYLSLIRSEVGVVSDFKAQLYFDEHVDSFRKSDFFMTDSQLKARFKGLFSNLKRNNFFAELSNDNKYYLPEVIEYQKRSFYIDVNQKLDGSEHSIKQRYRQSKSTCKIVTNSNIKNNLAKGQKIELSGNIF